MFRQSIIYLILSIFVVLFAKYIHLLIVYIGMGYVFLNVKLIPIFNTTPFGIMIRNVFSLTLLPAIIVGIPALAYRAIKGKTMPYLIETAWIIWLIIVLSKVLIH